MCNKIRTFSQWYFLKQYHQVTLFAYKNELKLFNNQCFSFRLKTVFLTNWTDDSFHIKSTLTLRIFSQQQSFHALLSQSKVIMIFETSEWHYVNLGETLKKKKKKNEMKRNSS